MVIFPMTPIGWYWVLISSDWLNLRFIEPPIMLLADMNLMKGLNMPVAGMILQNTCYHCSLLTDCCYLLPANC